MPLHQGGVLEFIDEEMPEKTQLLKKRIPVGIGNGIVQQRVAFRQKEGIGLFLDGFNMLLQGGQHQKAVSVFSQNIVGEKVFRIIYYDFLDLRENIFHLFGKFCPQTLFSLFLGLSTLFRRGKDFLFVHFLQTLACFKAFFQVERIFRDARNMLVPIIRPIG